uniref:S-type anion channel SLAH2-like n=1 Tax=Nelumbo nucifera TaxID=4432 RepID=A0A822ZDN3_NELNU|nr:TPA_asm: hypothetical protein HUJ06_001462 [Nelumbo nucifera]
MSICKWVDMEDNKCQNLLKQDSPEELPSLLKYIESKTVSGFDDIEECGSLNQQLQSTARTTPTSDPVCALAKRQEDASQATNSERLHSVSISMPSSPLGNDLESNRKVLLMDNDEMDVSRKNPNFRDTPVDVSSKQPKQAKFHSQPIPVAVGIAYVDAVCSTGKASGPSEGQLRNSRIDEFKDKSFDSFKTWSGRLERQLSHLRGKQCDPEPEVNTTQNSEIEVLSVDRYFDALEGPELDTLKDSEGLVLPEDKQWPFLLRYPISAFGMCLGVSSQAILWKTLATSTSTSFLHINLSVNLVLWCISIGLTALILLIYSLKFILYFEAVRREYYHPIRVNFFFAPWIAFLFLALGAPPSLAKNLHAALWYILMSPIFCLELKIYGQWMSGAPSVASMAWANIQGSFDYGSRVAYFIALFLYVSLAVRANFFKGFRFSLAWWAYTFPMTGASIATIRYSSVVKNPVTQSLSVILSAISTLTVTALLITTILHAFVFRDLFPNDIAIAITTKRPKKSKKQFHLSSGNSDAKDIEASLKSAGSDGEGTEVSLRSISVDKK